MPVKARGRRWGAERVGRTLGRAAAILSLGAALCTAQTPPPQAQGYRLDFNEEFDKPDIAVGGIKTHTWYRGVWFSQQVAPPANIYWEQSKLSLLWTRAQGGVDTSITTLSPDKKHRRAWRYGYFEARLRWDPVKGAWPAFWLIPVQDATGQNYYGGVKRSGELDVYEGQGDRPHTFYGTLHEWINSHEDHASRNNYFPLPSNADPAQFHTYGALWTPGHVTWYFDDHPLHTEPTPEVFDRQDFFLVLTMQAGVNWRVGDLSGVDANRMKMDVDWVRVWQK
jgi:hypothetical protein